MKNKVIIFIITILSIISSPIVSQNDSIRKKGDFNVSFGIGIALPNSNYGDVEIESLPNSLKDTIGKATPGLGGDFILGYSLLEQVDLEVIFKLSFIATEGATYDGYYSSSGLLIGGKYIFINKNKLNVYAGGHIGSTGTSIDISSLNIRNKGLEDKFTFSPIIGIDFENIFNKHNFTNLRTAISYISSPGGGYFTINGGLVMNLFNFKEKADNNYYY